MGNEIEPSLRTTILACRAVSRGDTEASRFLRDEGVIDISPDSIRNLRARHKDEFEALRAKYGPKLEETVTNQKLENALKAEYIIGKAIEKTEGFLETGRAEPHRVAGEMSQVSQRTIHTKLALEGRPVRTTATIAELPEIVSRLKQIGVLEEDEPIEGTVEDD